MSDDVYEVVESVQSILKMEERSPVKRLGHIVNRRGSPYGDRHVREDDKQMEAPIGQSTRRLRQPVQGLLCSWFIIF